MDTIDDALRSHFYVLAESPVEAERLHQQSLIVGEATQLILDGLDLTSGMHCLEIGCGYAT